MATLLVANIANRVSTLIQDVTNVRWPTNELLNWINDGQREVVLLRPQASIKNSSVQLVSGTKQTLPSDGVLLIDIVRNMGTNGTTAGNAIRVSSREVLDAQVSTWHSGTASAVVQHFMYDPRDPKTYYIYPPQPGSNMNQVEMIYAAAPTDCLDYIANPNTTIQIDDIYGNSLLDYMLYRAYSKDAQFAQNSPLAEAHYQAFQAALTAKTGLETSQNPNLSMMPFNPNVPAQAK
jgi:hypothetical protein